MMNARTLLHLSITKLEDMFASGRDDVPLLKRLESELNYRDTNRALKLLGEVQKELEKAGRQMPARKPVTSPARAPAPISAPKHPELWEAPKKEATVAPPAEARVTAETTPQKPAVPEGESLIVVPSALPKPAPTSPQVERARPELPPVSAADAYTILQVSPGSSWETVEASRRRVVQKAFPEFWKSEQAKEWDKAQYAARLANKAYRVLWEMRLPSTQPSV